LIYPGVKFTSYAKISERFEQSSIVCSAASKSFNLAGLKTSSIIIPDPELREKFQKVLKRNGLLGTNAFGLTATQAAYNHCAGWLQEVMEYIAGNYDYMAQFVAANLPELEVIKPEGTYLLWVDFRRLGLSPEERKQFMLEEARLLLDEGEMFGAGGEGFERFNIACPRSILEEALTRIESAVGRLQPTGEVTGQ
jgi:cystathionine beta-lyase